MEQVGQRLLILIRHETLKQDVEQRLQQLYQGEKLQELELVMQNNGMVLHGLKLEILMKVEFILEEPEYHLHVYHLEVNQDQQYLLKQNNGMILHGQKLQIYQQLELEEDLEEHYSLHFLLLEQHLVQQQELIIQKNGIIHLPLLLVHGHQVEIYLLQEVWLRLWELKQQL